MAASPWACREKTRWGAVLNRTAQNEIKPYIVRQGMTMQEVVDLLAGEYGWSDSVSNRPDKLQRESLRSTEAVQLAEVLDYETVWKKRGVR